MELYNAAQQKTFNAEKQIAIVRGIVIVFGTITFFLIHNPYVKKELSFVLIALIWLYGSYVIFFKPYEKYPIFLASWFTYTSDCIFATSWIYATGGFYSPYHVIYYTSIIAVAYRFDLKTTLFTSALYTLFYFVLLTIMGHLSGNEALAIVRTGFIFIIGFLTYYITKETLYQTTQKILMQKLAEDAQEKERELQKSQLAQARLNDELQLKNDIYSHAEENANIGSYAWHLHSNHMAYSDNLYRLLGYEPGEFVPSLEKYISFVHPDDRAAAETSGEITLKTRIVKPGTNRLITKSANVIYVKTTGKFTGDGDNLMMIGTVQDITADVELNAMLKAKNNELERSNNELASFNYVASHDLQEPVRKIHTFSQLILDNNKDQLSGTSRNYLSRIAASASRMQHLIEAFLNYSKLDRSDIEFEKSSLNKIIEDVKTDLSETLSEKSAVLHADDLPWVQVVPIQIHQLFFNLIGNALKYSKKDVTPMIEISAEKVPGSALTWKGVNTAAAYWKIDVADNGIGFEPQYAEKIFEVFQRLHSKDAYAGTGIGLAICKKIALTHGGYITATGHPGTGSVFSVYFPA